MTTRTIVLSILFLLGSAGAPAANGDDGSTLLAPCPSSPNCVSSEATTEQHGIAPLTFSGDPRAAWQRARAALLSLPRTRILVDEAGYIRAESTTALMRYVDDLEIHLQPDTGEIAMRSASRVGYGDMGANRARVEALRAAYNAEASR